MDKIVLATNSVPSISLLLDFIACHKSRGSQTVPFSSFENFQVARGCSSSSGTSSTVHLSTATRERLWATRPNVGQVTNSSSSGGSGGGGAAAPSSTSSGNAATTGGRNRRLSGNHYNIYAASTDNNAGYRSDSSINGVVESLPPYNNIQHYPKVEGNSTRSSV